MKKYELPEIGIAEFSTESLLTASDEGLKNPAMERAVRDGNAMKDSLGTVSIYMDMDA